MSAVFYAYLIPSQDESNTLKIANFYSGYVFFRLDDYDCCGLYFECLRSKCKFFQYNLLLFRCDSDDSDVFVYCGFTV